MNLRLITWNLHGLPPPSHFGAAKHIRRAAEATFRRQPGIVCFQEVWRQSYAVEVAALCVDAGYLLVPAGAGGPPSGGLLTLYRTSQWTLLNAHFARFGRHAAAWRIWEGDGLSHKGVLRADLKDNATQLTIVVLNTHLQSPYGPHRAYQQVRSAQIAQLGKEADYVAQSGAPVIAAGDFNTLPSEPLYDALHDGWIDLTANYRSACEVAGVGPCGTYLERRGVKGWLDYVLARPNPAFSYGAEVDLIQNLRRDEPYSDHQGIQLDISIRNDRLDAVMEVFDNQARITRRKAIQLLRSRL